MYIVERHLKEYAEQNPELVSVRTSLRYPNLRVVKYKNKVFYRNLWTPELQEMRGLIVDENWGVRVRPFTKIFNRGERKTDFDFGTWVCATRKINGFMACLTKDEDYGYIISTTGSLDSPYVALAEKYLNPLKTHGLINGVTYIFEIVDPSDPHIIDEEQGAYLIGARTVCSRIDLLQCDLDLIAQGFGVKRPEWKLCYFGEVVNESKSCRHEGFVVYDPSSQRSLKLKSPYYLTKKFFARASDSKFTPEWFHNNRETFEEEYFPLFDNISDNMAHFQGLDQESRKAYIEAFLNR